MYIRKSMVIMAGLWTLIMAGCSTTRQSAPVVPTPLTASNNTKDDTKGKVVQQVSTPTITKTPSETQGVALTPPVVPADINSQNKPISPVGQIIKKPLSFEVLYFDYDSPILRKETREALVKNFERMSTAPESSFVLEGHCDERGSAEYNQALGEKRAKAVEQYLITLGFSAERLFTVSYGKEAPAVHGDDEAAWSKNRRVVIKIKELLNR
jgi:peptidoglycan-associated lipoprotein